MVFCSKLCLRVQKERSQKHFLFGPKVSELGPNLAHLVRQENALIFILRLLLRRTFSFHAFSYNAYFHSPLLLQHLFFIPRPLLLRLFLFRAISQYAYFHYVNTVEGLQYTQSTRVSVPSSELGPPHPLHRKGKWLHPWPLGLKWGGGDTFASGRGSVGGPNSDEGTEYLVLYVYLTIIPLR